MQIKTIRHHSTPIEQAKSRTFKVSNTDEEVDQLLMEMQNGTSLWKTVWQFLEKTKLLPMIQQSCSLTFTQRY